MIISNSVIHNTGNLKLISKSTAILIILLAAIVLTGWVLSIPILQSIVPGLNGMKPDTAIAFIFTGLALWFSNDGEVKKHNNRFAYTSIIVILFTGAVSLLFEIVSIRFGISDLFVTLSNGPGNGNKSIRMSPATAFNFLLIGSSVLLYSRKIFTLSLIVNLFIVPISIFAFLNYLFDSKSMLYPDTFSSMSFPTAITFILVAISFVSLPTDSGNEVGIIFPKRIGSKWKPFVVAAIIIALAAVLRLWPFQSLGLRTVWVTFYPAVMLAAVYGGLFAGLFAAFLSCLVALFLWPVFVTQPFIKDSGDWLSMAVFIVTCIMISGIAEAMIRAREKAKQINQQLETVNKKLGKEISDKQNAEDEIRNLNKELEQRVLKRTEELAIANEVLQKGEERFRSTLDNMLEGCQIIGSDWRYIYINRAAEIHNRRPNVELLGNRYMDMWPGIKTTEVFAVIKRCMEERTAHHMENEFEFPDGAKGWFDLSIQPVPEGVFILSIDITERKRIEFNEKLAHEVLELLNAKESSEAMIRAVIYSIKNYTGIQAVAIRLKEGDDYPYFHTDGFEDNFVKTEMHLCNYDKGGNVIKDQNGNPLLDCMCGNILCGRVDPTKSFFTEGGSFRSNNTTQLLATTSDKDRMARTRNRCNSAGYESVALIPIRSGQEIIGLLQLNDKRKNMFNEEIIPFFEGLCSSIGIALVRNKAEEQIKQLNAELEERVIQRTQQLEAVNNELESFTYSVSHDLRAPLRHINGFVELLNEQSSSFDDGSKRFLGIISSSAKQMGQLIDDMLHFSRMGKTSLNLAVIDLHDMVNSIIDGSKKSAAKEITWIVEQLPSVYADQAMMKLVYENLIGNAVKYSSKAGAPRIEIGCTANETENVFYVKDNGAGFDMKYVQKLFGVFQRLHGNDEFEGTGIGLATVRRIITRHNGRTWAEGEVGKGAAFYFSLPKENIPADSV